MGEAGAGARPRRGLGTHPPLPPLPPGAAAAVARARRTGRGEGKAAGRARAHVSRGASRRPGPSRRRVTNGGKTTLTRKLMQALPNCSVVHQDDFFKVRRAPAGPATGGGGRGVSLVLPPRSARRPARGPRRPPALGRGSSAASAGLGWTGRVAGPRCRVSRSMTFRFLWAPYGGKIEEQATLS